MLISIVMMIAKLELDPVVPACEYAAEILCLELAVDGAQLEQVINGPTSVNMWRFHLLLDFPYLVLYATVLAGAFFGIERGGRLAASFAVLAALLDAVENTSLWLALGEPTDALATWARSAALTKFFLLALGVSLGMALLARASDRFGPRIGFAAIALIAGIGLAGPVSPVALEIGGLGLALAVITLSARAFRRSGAAG